MKTKEGKKWAANQRVHQIFNLSLLLEGEYIFHTCVEHVHFTLYVKVREHLIEFVKEITTGRTLEMCLCQMSNCNSTGRDFGSLHIIGAHVLHNVTYEIYAAYSLHMHNMSNTESNNYMFVYKKTKTEFKGLVRILGGLFSSGDLEETYNFSFPRVK